MPRNTLQEAIEDSPELGQAERYFVWGKLAIDPGPGMPAETQAAMVATQLTGYNDVAAILYSLFDQAYQIDGAEGVRIMEALAAQIAQDVQGVASDGRLITVLAQRIEQALPPQS